MGLDLLRSCAERPANVDGNYASRGESDRRQLVLRAVRSVKERRHWEVDVLQDIGDDESGLEGVVNSPVTPPLIAAQRVALGSRMVVEASKRGLALYSVSPF